MQLPISKRVALLGMMLSLSLILGYVESLFPLSFAVPGIKIGLSNLSVLVCIYLFNPAYAIGLAIIKAILCNALFGNFSMMLYSLSGAVLSVIIMILLKKTNKVHIPVVSALGAVMHNVGQLITASAIIGNTGIFGYLPILMFFGLVFGGIIGIAGNIIISRLKRYIYKET